MLGEDNKEGHLIGSGVGNQAHNFEKYVCDCMRGVQDANCLLH